jgi:hypothetical protein
MYKSLQLRGKFSHCTYNVTDRTEKIWLRGKKVLLFTVHSAQYPQGLLLNGQLRREADPPHPFNSKIKNDWNCGLPLISRPSKRLGTSDNNKISRKFSR